MTFTKVSDFYDYWQKIRFRFFRIFFFDFSNIIKLSNVQRFFEIFSIFSIFFQRLSISDFFLIFSYFFIMQRFFILKFYNFFLFKFSSILTFFNDFFCTKCKYLKNILTLFLFGFLTPNTSFCLFSSYVVNGKFTGITLNSFCWFES